MRHGRLHPFTVSGTLLETDNYSYRFTARAAARRTTPATLEAARAGSPWPS